MTEKATIDLYKKTFKYMDQFVVILKDRFDEIARGKGESEAKSDGIYKLLLRTVFHINKNDYSYIFEYIIQNITDFIENRKKELSTTFLGTYYTSQVFEEEFDPLYKKFLEEYDEEAKVKPINIKNKTEKLIKGYDTFLNEQIGLDVDEDFIPDFLVFIMFSRISL